MKNKWELPSGYSLRLAEQKDENFLLSLFYSARPELTLLPLPREQLTQLMRQQYSLQQHGYGTQYPCAENWIIVVDSVAVGKIMFERSQSGLHIIDFIIAPDWRGQGVGGIILDVLKAHLDKHASVLSLRVDHQNFQAKRFYCRLGFVMKESSDTHEFLVWSPANQNDITV